MSSPAARRPHTASRIVLTTAVAVAECAHLGWEHMHGGIASHHLLDDASLPALWNGWGLVLLPALAWIASRNAFTAPRVGWMPDPGFLRRVGGALLAGGVLSVAFSMRWEDAALAVLVGIALASLLLRAYRPEYLLGFALGMAFTFGGVLPLLIGGAIALISAGAWFGLRPVVSRIVAMTRA